VNIDVIRLALALERLEGKNELSITDGYSYRDAAAVIAAEYEPLREAQQCSACQHVTCSMCGFVVRPHQEQEFRTHVCAVAA
jgi:hypothetical protein